MRDSDVLLQKNCAPPPSNLQHVRTALPFHEKLT